MRPEALTRQAIRLAQRESRKRGHTLTREEVLHLRVQTVDPWKRVVFIGLGAVVAVLAAPVHLSGGPWWVWGLLAVAGLACMLIGILGRKEYLDRQAKRFGEEAINGIADAILNALI